MRISIGLFAIAAFAAQNAADQPKFDVASVKRAECSMENSIDPGMVTLKGFPIKAVLAEAFQVKMDQIEGPSRLDNDCRPYRQNARRSGQRSDAGDASGAAGR